MNEETQLQDHSYEEIRNAAILIIAGRLPKLKRELHQQADLEFAIGQYFADFNDAILWNYGSSSALSEQDKGLVEEVFWELFREGIITLGLDSSNRGYPWFRVSSLGKKILTNGNPYFFHDLSSYEKLIRTEIPRINETTLLYLQEAIQCFRIGCTLAASVMLGVAAEHTFELLLENINSNPKIAKDYSSIANERTILAKITKFTNIIKTQLKLLPNNISEELETNFNGILYLIRTFRNQSGHPSGKIINREQVYVNLQMFIPYAKKVYQLREFFNK